MNAFRNKTFLLLFLFPFIFTGCELEHTEQSQATLIDKQQLLELVNEQRKKGCKCGDKDMPPVDPLEWDDELERAAKAHSIDMNVESYFSHTSLDGSTFADRINGTEYEGSPGGENIAMGYADETSVISGWLNSAGHCRNIMNGSFTHMAVGRSGSYWTQVFGRE
jgi:uncharacterized protein YkwD